MNIAQAKQQIKDAVEAYYQKDEAGLYVVDTSKQRPLFLVGAPGIGKTAIMSQIAHELGIGLVTYSMTHHTRQSALGLPFIVHHNFEGFEYEASEYTMSEIISSMYDYMDTTGLKQGILFLDEINCVSETLYPSMLQFLQFKTFGRHRIPDDWIVVCAGNPPEYNKSVHEFDVVTLDRLRKLSIEPDYAAWRKYAVDRNVHPAILSFLEIKKEYFYSVETTPEGKVFVTARGWDDLSDLITLFERMGKPIDMALIGQFLQKPETAERFAMYYELFKKYRSDYQVDGILHGVYTEDIVNRAREAQFDERLALLGLMIDGLADDAAGVLQQEQAIRTIRDILRGMKVALTEKAASLEDTLVIETNKLEQSLASAHKNDTMDGNEIRDGRFTVTKLKELHAACGAEGKTEGPAAFEVLSQVYAGFVANMQKDATEVQNEIACAFAFLEEAFGSGKEELVLATEITARRVTAGFISRFGSDAYYEHNEGMLVENRREDLVSRISELDLEALEAQSVSRFEAIAPHESDSVGLRKDTSKTAGEGSAYLDAYTYAYEASIAQAQAEEQQEQAVAEAFNEEESVVQAARKQEGRTSKLAEYYRQLQLEDGYFSLCKMLFPEKMAGMSVLDIGCRRGKGVFKFSDYVGPTGRAVGVDWNDEFLAEARENMEVAFKKSGYPENIMEFGFAYPEDLSLAGLRDDTFDMVYMNSVLNLAYDPEAAIREIARVLRSGGQFCGQMVLASAPRDPEVVKEARRLANSVQAAPFEDEFTEMLVNAGFTDVRADIDEEVMPQWSAFSNVDVATAPSDEDVRFFSIEVLATKRG